MTTDTLRQPLAELSGLRLEVSRLQDALADSIVAEYAERYRYNRLFTLLAADRAELQRIRFEADMRWYHEGRYEATGHDRQGRSYVTVEDVGDNEIDAVEFRRESNARYDWKHAG